MTLSKKQVFPLLLISVMALTRFDHFGSSFTLPDASLAVFFLMPFCSGSLWLFALLLVEAGMIDYLAITQFNVSDYCISPAYVFLIPAYTALWCAGLRSKTFKSTGIASQIKALGLAVAACTAAFTISNGSFYALSGRIETLSWTHFAEQFGHYYPIYLISCLCYVLAGLLSFKLFALIPAPPVTVTTR